MYRERQGWPCQKKDGNLDEQEDVSAIEVCVLCKRWSIDLSKVSRLTGVNILPNASFRA
jgi:hypothetical protein